MPEGKSKSLAERKVFDMRESILQKEKKCLVCGKRSALHLHHVYGGYGNRQISDEHGFTVWLCGKHHNLSDVGVHSNPALDEAIKKECQRKYEETHSREDFMRLIGWNYLED